MRRSFRPRAKSATSLCPPSGNHALTYDFRAELASAAQDIEAALDHLLTVGTLSGPGAAPQRLVDAMRHGSLNGGKRLRPLLVRQAAAVLGKGADDALTAGLAVEAIHCYSLIHDDLPAMDDDDLRRGKPTVHKAFDEATAILAGDGLLTLAFGLLAGEKAHPDPATRVRLVAELAAGAGLGGMVGGQMADIEGETMPLGEQAIADMQAMKTGALIRASVRMGAILGGATTDELAALTGYAEAAGRAFQLADDILDVTATAEAMGKATGKDADRNKQTLVARFGLLEARQRLSQMVGEAVARIERFDDRADGLRATVRFFAERQS